jgi:hypothetical protein
MLREITWLQFVEWMAYSQVERFDEVRADLRAASICAMLANIHRNPKKRATPFNVSDFLLDFEGTPKRRQTWQEQKMIAQMIVAAYNGPEKKAK